LNLSQLPTERQVNWITSLTHTSLLLPFGIPCPVTQGANPSFITNCKLHSTHQENKVEPPNFALALGNTYISALK
jgi:hypothetical protein